MKTIDKLLFKIAERFALVEVLGTGATLIRFSNLRILVLNGYQGANSTLTIPTADRPPSSISVTVPILRTNASNLGTCIGYVAIGSTNGYVQRYYASAYNSASMGLSNVASTDKSYGIAAWIIGGGYGLTSILSRLSAIFRDWRWSHENSMELTGEVADHISCCKRRIKIHQDKEDRHLLGESTNKQQRLMHRKSSVDVSKYHGDVYNRHCIIWRESSICRSNGINTSRKHTGLYQSLCKVLYVSSCKLLRWLACNRFAVALERGCC